MNIFEFQLMPFDTNTFDPNICNIFNGKNTSESGQNKGY